MTQPNVVKHGLLDMQICVPKEYTDAQVVEAANRLNPCGTNNGWFIRKQGSKYLAGKDERVTCAKDPDNVHIMLDA